MNFGNCADPSPLRALFGPIALYYVAQEAGANTRPRVPPQNSRPYVRSDSSSSCTSRLSLSATSTRAVLWPSLIGLMQRPRSEPQPDGVITCCGTPSGVSTCTRRASATMRSSRATLTSCGRWKVPGTWVGAAATARARGVRGKWRRSRTGEPSAAPLRHRHLACAGLGALASCA